MRWPRVDGIKAELSSSLVRDEVETELEFVRVEGCDEGFSGEVW